MKIIKRNGSEVVFDISKIEMAITKANEAVEEKVRMTPLQIQRISQSVAIACEEMGRSPSVEEIQDLVEKSIMAHGAFEVAKEYITYRYTRNQETRQQHGEVYRAHHEQHAYHVHQQVISINKLTAILVGQESADDGTDGSTQTVCTDEVEPSQVHLRQSQVVLPQGKSARTGHNGTGIQIIGERYRDGTLQTIAFL